MNDEDPVEIRQKWQRELNDLLIEVTNPLSKAVALASLLGDTKLSQALNNIVIMFFKEALRPDDERLKGD